MDKNLVSSRGSGNKEVVKEILERHQHYLQKDVVGWEAMRADLQYADLRGADLREADLREANLRGADLREADLRGANLSGADLREADLRGANLSGADLSGATLREATLREATLREANIREANLRGADLDDADLREASLREANLREATLRGADLSGAYLDDATLSGALLDEEEEYRKGEILSESIIGWKKCEDDVYVELEIPKGAIVFSINGDKCRTNKCNVVSVSNGDIGISMYDENFTYEVGKEIEIQDFNLMYNIECGSGIHFFKTREDAENY